MKHDAFCLLVLPPGIGRLGFGPGLGFFRVDRRFPESISSNLLAYFREISTEIHFFFFLRVPARVLALPAQVSTPNKEGASRSLSSMACAALVPVVPCAVRRGPGQLPWSALSLRCCVVVGRVWRKLVLDPRAARVQYSTSNWTFPDFSPPESSYPFSTARRFPGKFPEFTFSSGSQISSGISGNLWKAQSRDTCAQTQTAARPALLVPARQHSRQIGLATSHQFQVHRALRKPSPCPVHQGRPFWPRFAAAARAHPVYRGAGLVGEPRTARVARQHRGRRGPVFVLVRNYWVWWVGRYLQNSDSFGLSPSSIGCLSLRFAPERVDHLTP